MIGQTLGHYRIEAKLGEGGMGVVYKAHDMHLDRAVAIKVLSAEAVSDPERKRRFVQEARTASALNHPNILHIYDIDQSDGIDFMVMEFVSGKTIYQIAGHAGLRIDESLDYAGQIAGALARAHEAGIVHRDIKPGNIMVTEEGLVKVLDFGLAKLNAPATEVGDAILTRTVAPQTDAGVIMGTVEYMAPEQAEGTGVDARSDIFSFGTVLYEMVTGRRPFQGSSKMAILAAVLGKEPPPLSQVRKNLPAGLESVVSRCLRKDPEQRFQTMREVAAALEQIKETQRRPASASRWWQWAAIAALAAIVLLVAALVSRRLSHGEPQQALIAVLPFQTAAADPAGQASVDGLRETLSRELVWLNQFQPDKRVVPPGDVRGEAALGAREAHKRLGANLALTGTMERTQSDVRWSLRLLQMSPLHDAIREVKRVEWVTPLADTAARQQGLVSKAAQFLDLRLPPQAERLPAIGTTQVADAYDAYLQGYGRLAHADRAEDLELAIASFQAALAKDPSYGAAEAGLGEAYWAKSSLTQDKELADKARESCQRAIGDKADLPAVHLILGRIDSGAGRSQDAVDEFRKALQLDPLSIAAHTALGGAYESLGQLNDSENTYKALIAKWPGYIVPYSFLGSFYVQQGRYRDAEPVFRKFADLAPESPSGYQNLGAVYHLMGRTDDAAAMMKKSLAIQPTARGYTNLGTLYFFEGRYSDAVPLMEKATEMEAGNYVYWGNLGDAYRWAPDEKQRAAEAYRQAIKLAEQQAEARPRDPEVRSDLASYQAKLPDAPIALSQIAQARRLAPMNPQVLFKAALVYEISGRRDQAIGALDLALQSGYSIDEVRREPDLAELRKDSRYAQLDARAAAAGKRTR